MKLGLDASFLSFSHFFCSFVVLFQFNALTWSLLNNFQGNALVLTIVILRELFSRFVHLPICALLSSACRCPPGTLSHPTHINTIKISQFHPALVFLKPERTMLQSNPPLLQHYGALVRQPTEFPALVCNEPKNRVVMEECQLPLIDLNDLNRDNEREKLACCEAICRASSEWGFFQVVNHGISPELLRRMRREQVKLFQTPFEKKTTCGLLNNSYRWGTPTATSPKQFSWSEAFHIPLSQISEEACYGEYNSLREVMKEFAAAMLKLARLLAGILAENLGNQKTVFEDICEESTCFLRLNRYPACPISPEIFGLVPHTDSDFLTILCQDEVGGLQLMKDSQWVSAKPIKDALVVNIGDLFQAWSNNVYKSVEHKVMANRTTERYSMAYFLCPSYDSLIASCGEPSIYRKFTFGEYRSQVREDVQKTGYKVGLPRFLL